MRSCFFAGMGPQPMRDFGTMVIATPLGPPGSLLPAIFAILFLGGESPLTPGPQDCAERNRAKPGS